VECGISVGSAAVPGVSATVGVVLEDGEELAVVSRALGHADLSTTADVYAHLTSKMLERAADRMDRILTPREAASG
jgi:integrase